MIGGTEGGSPGSESKLSLLLLAKKKKTFEVWDDPIRDGVENNVIQISHWLTIGSVRLMLTWFGILAVTSEQKKRRIKSKDHHFSPSKGSTNEIRTR
jgi:hypothetical protein